MVCLMSPLAYDEMLRVVGQLLAWPARLQEIHCVYFSSGHSTNERSCLEAGLEIDLLRSPNQPLTQSGSCQQCHHLLHPHICWGFFSTVLLGRVFMTSFLFFGPCFHT